LNDAVERLNRRSPVLLLAPYGRALGDCATDIYYGLLKARREGKKAAFLRISAGSGFPFKIANSALFDLDSELCVSPATFRRRVAQWLLTPVVVILRLWYPIGRRLPTLVGKPEKIDPYYVVPTVGRSTLWQPDGTTRFSWDVVEDLQWQKQYQEPIMVSLSPPGQHEATQMRAALGLPPDAWFACVHVREGGFRKDWNTDTYRNSSILNYIPAIQAITAANGYVVRLGDPSMVKLPALDRLIDYAHSGDRSEVMDLYLIRECRFFVGTVSGPIEVAWLFQRPVLGTNQIDWISYFPRKAGDRAILKHVYSRANQRFLSLQEVLEHPEFSLYGLGEAYEQDYEVAENSPAELRDAVLEFMEGLEAGPGRACSPLQEEFNRRRKLRLREWVVDPGTTFSRDPCEDVIQRYRHAAADSFAGALGERFLEANWFRDSPTEDAAENSPARA